jgi:tRNA modification GTPase
MLPRHDEPIVAIATAAGRGAVGIVRASGRDLSALIEGVCDRPLAPRHATLTSFRDAAGQPIDRGIALHFPAPHSYTGEDVLELHAHGGPVVLQLLLARCIEALPGLRLAEPGEFTERAFLNDKLDLAQAEAVADLIEASTEAAARSAGRSLAGAFSTEVTALAGELLQLRMLVEATLDFPEEEIDFLERADALGRLQRIASRLETVFSRARQGALLREGMRVVLAGQPNVGKSSLLNALAGAELAIVTAIPGTTRDRVSETIQIEGVPLHVTDTAGIRDESEAADEAERIGIERTWAAVADADAVLFVHDLTRIGEPRHDADDARVEQRLLAHGVAGERLLHVYNKADAARADPAGDAPPGLAVSALRGDGIEALRRRLLEFAGWHADAGGAEGLFTARARHLAALRAAAAHIETALSHARAGVPALELMAEELRLAHDQLGRITGAVSADDLLGEIFRGFCIGK